jgi:hypothetical protein
MKNFRFTAFWMNPANQIKASRFQAKSSVCNLFWCQMKQVKPFVMFIVVSILSFAPSALTQREVEAHVTFFGWNSRE